MSGAQSWTLIGGFLAILAATSGLLLTLIRAEIAGLRAEMAGLLAGMVARFDALDRDVQRLCERVSERPA